MPRFDKFSSQPSWAKIRGDLDKTLADARQITIDLLSHEDGECKALDGFDTTENIDELDDLPELISDLADLVKLPDHAPATLEDDEICRISAVLVMLSQTCAHIAGIIKMGLQAA